MPDLKTVIYSMTPSASGDYISTSALNKADSFVLSTASTSGGTWTDQTSSVEPTNTVSLNLNNIGGTNYAAVNSTWYIGKATPFDTFSLHFGASTSNDGSRSVVYEYWNGSTWVDIPKAAGITQSISVLTGAINIVNTQLYNFKLNPLIYPSWGVGANTFSPNLDSSLYYIRMVMTVSGFTNANLQSLSVYDQTGATGFPAYKKIFQTVNDVAFTDNTIAGRSGVTHAFTFTANTTAARLYLGSNKADDLGLTFFCATAGNGAAGSPPNVAGVWEYWNGSAWTDISYHIAGYPGATTGTLDSFRLINPQTLLFDNGPLSNFTASTINGVSAYWIRFRVTVAYTTNPQITYIVPNESTTISRTVWLPEATNRTIKSAVLKLHLSNPDFGVPSKFIAVGRFGSDAYVPLRVGEGTQNGSPFYDIGGKIWSTTANDAVFTDETVDGSNTGTNNITVTNTVNSSIYFGYPNNSKFAKDELVLTINPNNTTRNTGGIVEWEYWNGSAWTAFTPVTLYCDKNLNSTNLGNKYVVIPILSGWTANDVNGFTGYYIRRRITQVYDTVANHTFICTSMPGINQAVIGNSVESQTLTTFVDCTKLFQDSFTGASQTFDFKLAYTKLLLFTGNSFQVSGELYITYYADEQTTRIKTITIPLNGLDNTALTDTLTSVGSTELPALATYLPEASKTIRNFYIVFTGNDQINNYILTNEYRMKVGSAAERYSLGNTPCGNGSTLVKQMYVDDAISTASAQDIQVAISSRLNTFTNWAMYAVVTYEYNSATTTRTINSLTIPYASASGFAPQDNSEEAENIRKSFYIQEPGTIDNVRIGAYVSFCDPAIPILNIREKTESSFKKLIFNTNTNNCGGFRYGYRLPVTTLSRGLNEIGIDFYADSGQNSACVSFPCGFFVVNYHSDVYSGGIGKHNKTIYDIHQMQKFVQSRNVSFNSLSNPCTEWYINAAGFHGEHILTTTPNLSVSVDTRYVHTKNGKRVILAAGGGFTDNSEQLHYEVISDDFGTIKKYPGDVEPDRVIDIFDGGLFVSEWGSYSIYGGSQILLTCHEISYAVSGTIAGSSGGTVDITLHDLLTDEIILHTSRVGNGAYSFTWYDNTREVYVAAIESDTKKGISKQDVAGSGFDINLSATAGAQETKSYVWGA